MHSSWANPEMSPDGRHVAIWRTVGGNSDVWLFDLRRRALSRLPSHVSICDNLLWSPDGSLIVFSSNRKGVFDLYGSRPPAWEAKSRCWRPDRYWLRRISPPTGGSCCTAASIRQRGATSGHCRWWEGEGGIFPVVQTSANEQARAVLAGWKVGGVPVGRIRSLRGLSPAVPRARRPVADVHKRRRPVRGRQTAVGTIKYHTRRPPDGGSSDFSSLPAVEPRRRARRPRCFSQVSSPVCIQHPATVHAVPGRPALF